MSFDRISKLIAVFTLCTLMAKAQDKPIGYWESHLRYNVVQGLASDGNTIYAICPEAFFSFNGTAQNANPVTYSKVEGMSDIGMQCVGYDGTTGTTVLIYADGNIDLFKEKENTFYNVADLKVKSVSGSKTVNAIYTEHGMAYLSTSIGVLVLDLTTHNFAETYQFEINSAIITVNGFTGCGNYFYAITSAGVYRASKNNPQLQNFQVWQLVDTGVTYKCVTSVDNTLFLANTKSVYGLVNDTVRLKYTTLDTNGAIIQHIDSGSNGVFISQFYSKVFRGSVITLSTGFQITDSFLAGNPAQAVQLQDGSVWVADLYYGLGKRAGVGAEQYTVPQGPSGPYSFDIYANNKEVWVAHGGYNQDLYAQPSFQGVSNLKNGKWTAYKMGSYQPLSNVDDFVAVVKDEADGTVYMGSFLRGLFILHPDGKNAILNANSIFDSSNSVYGDNQRQVIGLALDQSRNLWVTEIGAYDQLYVKTPDSSWYKFHLPGGVAGGPLAIDGYGQVWFSSFAGSGGVCVYNCNGTIGDPTDDAFYHLTTGVGSGNLPSNNVYSIACDKNNSIWVGTDNGIGIISNCTATVGTAPCDGQIPIVQYDQFAGYLFAGNLVTAIAVDGANRKWVAAAGAGVWLLSPNANQIIYRFTSDNSPLPSNNVRKISIDKVTGDVYFGTDLGLVTFHSTATDGGTSNQNVEIFPNPVASNYTGTVAIKGLAANADVRITDIDGQLVYKTTALGGQAVWNGKDYKGHRPESGVYLVFVSSSDGAQTYTGKIVFMQ